MTKDRSKLYLEKAQGVPLQIVWDASTIPREYFEPVSPFPFEKLNQYRSTIESIRIAGRRAALMTFHGVQLASLRELRFDLLIWPDLPVEPTEQFTLIAPSLTRLRLR